MGDVSEAAVTAKLLVVNVPLLCVIAPVTISASCRVLVAVPAVVRPSVKVPLNVFPPFVMLNEPEEAGKETAPEWVQPIPATRVQLP